MAKDTIELVFKFKIKFDTVINCWRCHKKIPPGGWVYVFHRTDKAGLRRGFLWDEACTVEKYGVMKVRKVNEN